MYGSTATVNGSWRLEGNTASKFGGKGTPFPKSALDHPVMQSQST